MWFYDLSEGPITVFVCCRFVDASDVLGDRTCPICNMKFSASESEQLINSHVQDHLVKECPVCTQEFPPDDENYIMHVNMCLLAQNEQQPQPQPQTPPESDPFCLV